MRIAITVIATALFCLNSTCCLAQKCFDKIAYQTINIGNGKEFLDFPLNFSFVNDSLFVYPLQKNEIRYPSDSNKVWYPVEDKDLPPTFMKFKIISKNCNWKSDLKTGKSVYELLLADSTNPKEAKLTVVKEGSQQEIILLYAHSKEQSVFRMPQ